MTRRKYLISSESNKAIVGRWFTNFWGKTCNLGIVDEIAAPDMLLHYSLHEPRHGHEDKAEALLAGKRWLPELLREQAA